MAGKIKKLPGLTKLSLKISPILKMLEIEDNSVNILKSFHCTATLISRVMEYSNVVIMFEMLFMLHHLERKCFHSGNHAWKTTHQKHTRYTCVFVRTHQLSSALLYLLHLRYHYINHWLNYLIYFI